VATSTVPAFKSALLAKLNARTNLKNVQVTYGPPLPPSREWIWLGDVAGEQQTAALGNQRREETYDLSVIIGITREGVDQQATTERAFALMAELENELRSDATVGGVVRTAEVQGQFRLDELASDTARGAHLAITVQCTARI
jgi:hypothetical protein